MAHRTLLRSRTCEHHARVGFVELFFDLVFVFAATQISHLLLDHPDHRPYCFGRLRGGRGRSWRRFG